MKPDIADERESPAREVGRRLLQLGARLSYHDPYVSSWRVNGVTLPRAKLEPALGTADLVILLQDHSAYDDAAIAVRAAAVLDCRGQWQGENVERL